MACPNQYYYDQYGYYLSYVYPQYPTPVQATCQTLNPPSPAVLQSPAGPGCPTYTPTVQTVYQATQPATDYTNNSTQGCPETPYYNSQYIPEYTDDSSPSAYTCTPTQSSSTPTCTPNSIPVIHPPQTIPIPHPTRIFCQTDQDLIEQIKSLVETALSNTGLQKVGDQRTIFMLADPLNLAQHQLYDSYRMPNTVRSGLLFIRIMGQLYLSLNRNKIFRSRI